MKNYDKPSLPSAVHVRVSLLVDPNGFLLLKKISKLSFSNENNPRIAIIFSDFLVRDGNYNISCPTFGENLRLLGGNLHCFVFKGDSLYASSPEKVLLVVEKKIVIECKTVVKGLLLLQLSFFVFGLEYPLAVSLTLEFCQR